MKSQIYWLVLGALLLACGSTDSGGAKPSDDEQKKLPDLISVGPGRDASVPLECNSVQCLERPDGDYRLLERCESAGVLEDDSCPGATLTWESVSVSGDLAWYAGAFEFQVDQSVAWDVQYPADCASCEALEQQAQFSQLNCVEDGAGCGCTGIVQENFRILGSEATLADGSLVSVIESTGPDGVLDTMPREFEVAGCTDGVNLLLYHEDGQRYYFEKP